MGYEWHAVLNKPCVTAGGFLLKSSHSGDGLLTRMTILFMNGIPQSGRFLVNVGMQDLLDVSNLFNASNWLFLFRFRAQHLHNMKIRASIWKYVGNLKEGIKLCSGCNVAIVMTMCCFIKSLQIIMSIIDLYRGIIYNTYCPDIISSFVQLLA